MEYFYYKSPVGVLGISADELGITRLDFEKNVDKETIESTSKTTEATCNEHIQNTIVWLDEYFAGKIPNAEVKFHLSGTAFQMGVWKILQTIPYGQVISYGEIAEQVANKCGKERMSAQAVGGAVGRNPIGIIIPCHRVLGKDMSLTGFGGGLEIKRRLLEIEGVNYRK